MSQKKKTRIAPYKLRKDRNPTLFYYRTRITLASLVVFLVALTNQSIWYDWPVALVGYCTSVVLLDFFIYSVRGRKESNKITPQDLMKWNGMTPKALDAFIGTMVNLRRWTYLIALTGVVYSSLKDGMNPFVLFDWLAVLVLMRVVGLFYLVNVKHIKIPLSYTDCLAKAQKNGFHNDHFQSMHKRLSGPTRSTMDNAFYAGTGVITYRRR